MNKFERFALNHYLEIWPECCDFQEVVGLVRYNNPEVSVRNVYSVRPTFLVADLIVEMNNSLEEEFKLSQSYLAGKRDAYQELLDFYYGTEDSKK